MANYPHSRGKIILSLHYTSLQPAHCTLFDSTVNLGEEIWRNLKKCDSSKPEISSFREASPPKPSSSLPVWLWYGPKISGSQWSIQQTVQTMGYNENCPAWTLRFHGLHLWDVPDHQAKLPQFGWPAFQKEQAEKTTCFMIQWLLLKSSTTYSITSFY